MIILKNDSKWKLATAMESENTRQVKEVCQILFGGFFPQDGKWGTPQWISAKNIFR